MSDVKLVFTGSEQDAVRAIAAVERRLDGLQRKQKSLSDQVNRSNLALQAERWVYSLNLVDRAWGAIKNTIGQVIEENRKFLRETGQTGMRLEEEFDRLQIQSGKLPHEIQAMAPKILAAVKDVPAVSPVSALQIQREIASSGFAEESVDSAGALRAFLEMMGATNLFEGSGREAEFTNREIVNWFQMYLRANNEIPSEKGVRELGMAFAALAPQSNIKVPDLEFLSRQANLLAEYEVTKPQQLATFSVVRDVLGPEVGATGMAAAMKRLATASKLQTSVRALAELGLKPEDVDLVGESIYDAFGTIKERLKGHEKARAIGQQLGFVWDARGEIKRIEAEEKEKGGLPEEVQQRVTATLFERRGDLAAGLIMDNLEEIQRREKMATDPTMYQRGLQAFLQTRSASNLKIAAETEISRFARDQESGGVSWEEVRANLERLRAKGQVTALDMWIDKTQIWAYESMGDTPEDVLRRYGRMAQKGKLRESAPYYLIMPGERGEQQLRRAQGVPPKEQALKDEEALQIFRDIRDELRKNSPRRNGQGE
jgi:hypothetical protein